MPPRKDDSLIRKLGNRVIGLVLMAWLTVVFLPSCAQAQGTLMQLPPLTTSLGEPIAGATISVFTTTGNLPTLTCATPVTVYKDVALTIPFTTLTTDGAGNFPFFIAPSINPYGYTVSGQNTATSTCYGFSAAGPSIFGRDCSGDGVRAGVNNDQGPAITACLLNAFNFGESAIQFPPGVILISTCVNDTNKPGLQVNGVGSQRCRFGGSCGANYSTLPSTTVLKCNTGTIPCWDATGSGSQTFSNFTVDTFFTAPANPSTIGFLFGRDNAGGASPNQFAFSQWDLFENVQIQMAHSASANSNFGSIGVYNAAAEQMTFFNSSIFADTPAFFSGSNNLNVSSPYQTLITGSMSGVSFIATSLWFTSSTGAGIVAADGTSGFFIDAESNIHSKLDGTVTGPAILLTGSNIDVNWTIHGIHEDITSSGSNGAFINTVHGFDRFDIDVNLNDVRGSGSPAGFIQWGGVTGQTISNSRIKIKYSNGTGGNLYPLIQNTANTISESTIDLTSTLNPASFSSLTLDNVQIIAKGFTDANLTLPAAAKGTMQTDTGYSILGEHKYKRMRAGLGTTILSGDITLTGWGAGASVALGTGSNDSAFSMNITAGTTPSANPTASFNFKDGAWGNTPVCTAARGELNAPTTAFFTADALTTTFFQTTFAGTPVNGTTYIMRVICVDKG